MCDVTVDNFEEALARLRTIVPQSDFVSIDLEFTGLDQDVYNDASASSEGAPAANAGDAAAGGAAAGSGSKWFGGGPSFPGAPFDMRKEAQAKYSKMCETTKFLVVQVRAAQMHCFAPASCRWCFLMRCALRFVAVRTGVER